MQFVWLKSEHENFKKRLLKMLGVNRPAALLQDNMMFSYSKLCCMSFAIARSGRTILKLFRQIVKPAGCLIQPALEEFAGILRIPGLLVLEKHLIPHDAEYLNLAAFMGHGIAKPLAEPVKHPPRFCNNPVAFGKRDLKMIIHPFHRPALENIIGIDPDAHQIPLQVCQDCRGVVDIPEQNSLVVDDDT